MQESDVKKLRYNVKKPFRPIIKDAFLDAIMELLFIHNQMKNGVSTWKLRRLLEPVIKQLGLDICLTANDEDRRLLIDEYKEAGLLFIELGKDDRMYSKGVLKIGTLSDEKFEGKVKTDYDNISIKLPERVGMEEIFKPLSEGLTEAINTFFERTT